MLISKSWLDDWVSTPLDGAGLSDVLTLAGLEVEGYEAVTSLSLSAGNREKILIGQIVACNPHPNADRLKLCQVDVGKRRPLEIVCGAANARAGVRVPVALIGAKLPGVKIKKSEIRGVSSSGMLCSAAELGLAESSDGLMLLDEDAPVGGSVVEYLQLDDQSIEIDLTPNRGDCLSIIGIAREVSALTGGKMGARPMTAVKAGSKRRLEIELADPQACGRFAGRVIEGIDMGAKSPDWMCERLRRVGLRPINPVVDITNYVMIETGQPMHAYDFDKLNGGIVARMARKGEKLKLLDDSIVRLSENNLVIADHKKAVGLAGIMGGDNTAISDATTNIFFEAAYFSPAHIIGKARSFGMHTDASHRFERGVNPEGQIAAVEFATELLLNMAGGTPGPVCHAVSRKHLPKPKPIRFQRSEISRILGISVPNRDVRQILTRLGMQVETADQGWRVTPPSWRFDISGQHDLVEEVGRCYGFNRVPPRMPAATAVTGKHPEVRVDSRSVRRRLTELGYYEAITYSFIDPSQSSGLMESSKGIKLANPIADNMSEMRQSLLPGLLSALVRNVNRQESRVRLFEIGNVFKGRGKNKKEVTLVSGVVCGNAKPRQWAIEDRAVDFFDIKGDVENLLSLSGDRRSFQFVSGSYPVLHPGQSAEIKKNGKTVGKVGQLHPQKQNVLDLQQPVFVFELVLESFASSLLPRFQEISRFPAVQRDLSVVVSSEIEADKVLEIVRKTGGKALKNVELFDIYAGERVENNKKSFAFSLTFQSESSSLTSADIDADTTNIIKALQDSVGAELRT